MKYLQAYLWEDNEAVVNWMNEQEQLGEQSSLSENIKCLQCDHVIQQVKRFITLQYMSHL